MKTTEIKMAEWCEGSLVVATGSTISISDDYFHIRNLILSIIRMYYHLCDELENTNSDVRPLRHL